MAKICVPTLIRKSDHLFDPNVVEYEVTEDVLVDGEPVVHHSGQRIAMTITNATTLGDIQTAIEANATSLNWIP